MAVSKGLVTVFVANCQNKKGASMKNPKQFARKTRSRGALDTVQGPATIRDRVLGQNRSAPHRAWESPDEQDRFRAGRPVALHPPFMDRPGLGRQRACAGCGRTKDLWEENNGQGLSK